MRWGLLYDSPFALFRHPKGKDSVRELSEDSDSVLVGNPIAEPVRVVFLEERGKVQVEKMAFRGPGEIGVCTHQLIEP